MRSGLNVAFAIDTRMIEGMSASGGKTDMENRSTLCL